MQRLVFLPAMGPGDRTFGTPPIAWPGCQVQVLDFGRLVWYNREIRELAAARIQAAWQEPVLLVGFSKSGLGAINLAIEFPELVAGLLVFDAPLTRRELPPWQTAAFYDQAAWERDLPLNRLDALQPVLSHIPLVHMGGQNFGSEHRQFAAALDDRGLPHTYIDDPTRAHHWDSDWLTAGLRQLGC